MHAAFHTMYKISDPFEQCLTLSICAFNFKVTIQKWSDLTFPKHP